jgi:hypothetical protein
VTAIKSQVELPVTYSTGTCMLLSTCICFSWDQLSCSVLVSVIYVCRCAGKHVCSYICFTALLLCVPCSQPVVLPCSSVCTALSAMWRSGRASSACGAWWFICMRMSTLGSSLPASAGKVDAPARSAGCPQVALQASYELLALL